MDIYRRCKQCDLELLETEFYSYIKKNKKYYEGICKLCKSLRAKNYYIDNKILLLDNNKNYREQNKNKEKLRSQKYYLNHIDDRKVYYLNNRENILKNKHFYYEENKEEIKAYNAVRSKNKKI
jgi:hypothetical protein